MEPLRLTIFRYDNNNISGYNINYLNKITITIIRFLFRLRVIFFIIGKAIYVTRKIIIINIVTGDFIKIIIFKLSIYNKSRAFYIRKLYNIYVNIYIIELYLIKLLNAVNILFRILNSYLTFFKIII